MQFPVLTYPMALPGPFVLHFFRVAGTNPSRVRIYYAVSGTAAVPSLCNVQFCPITVVVAALMYAAMA